MPAARASQDRIELPEFEPSKRIDAELFCIDGTVIRELGEAVENRQIRWLCDRGLRQRNLEDDEEGDEEEDEEPEIGNDDDQATGDDAKDALSGNGNFLTGTTILVLDNADELPFAPAP